MRRLIAFLSVALAVDAMAGEGMTQLRQALDSGTVVLHGLSGTSDFATDDAIVGEIENVSDRPVALSFGFDVPIYFANLGSRQSMISTRIGLDAQVGVEIGQDGLSFTIQPGVRAKARFRSFCVDENLRIPTPEDEFRVADTPDWLLTTLENAGSLLDVAPTAGESSLFVIQKALWGEIETVKIEQGLIEVPPEDESTQE